MSAIALGQSPSMSSLVITPLEECGAKWWQCPCRKPQEQCHAGVFGKAKILKAFFSLPGSLTWYWKINIFTYNRKYILRSLFYHCKISLIGVYPYVICHSHCKSNLTLNVT